MYGAASKGLFCVALLASALTGMPIYLPACPHSTADVLFILCFFRFFPGSALQNDSADAKDLALAFATKKNAEHPAQLARYLSPSQVDVSQGPVSKYLLQAYGRANTVSDRFMQSPKATP